MWVKHLHMTNQQTVLLYIGSFCVLSHLLKRGKHLIVSSCLPRQLCPSSYTQKYIFIFYIKYHLLGFPDSSVGKESSCSAGDPGSIPGLGRSAREEIGYLLKYSWDSLVAQLVKNPPAMWENWVQSLGWEEPLEKEKLPIPVFWSGEFCRLNSPWGHKELGLSLSLIFYFSFTL